jgi:hypothetical protein
MIRNAEDDIAKWLSRELVRRPPHQRPEFLRAVITIAAAGLEVVAGRTNASEAVYRAADAIITCEDER